MPVSFLTLSATSVFYSLSCFPLSPISPYFILHPLLFILLYFILLLFFCFSFFFFHLYHIFLSPLFPPSLPPSLLQPINGFMGSWGGTSPCSTWPGSHIPWSSSCSPPSSVTWSLLKLSVCTPFLLVVMFSFAFKALTQSPDAKPTVCLFFGRFNMLNRRRLLAEHPIHLIGCSAWKLVMKTDCERYTQGSFNFFISLDQSYAH